MLRAKDAEAASAQQSASLTKKDFSKFEENSKRERKKASMAAYDYKSAVEDYENTRMRWEDDMQTACTEFQQAEEERLDFVKSTLQSYLDVQKKVNASCKEVWISRLRLLINLVLGNGRKQY